MNDEIFDRVRALHRPHGESAWAASDNGRAVMARAVSAGSVASVATAKQRPTPRLRVGIAAAALIVGTTAAATIKAVTADHPNQAGCFERLAADADTTEASAALVERVGSVEACRLTWDELDSDVDTDNLVSCINPNGGRGVFPVAVGVSAASACSRIGWQPED